MKKEHGLKKKIHSNHFLLLLLLLYYLLIESFSHQRYLMVFHWSLSNSKSPQVSRILLSILANLNNVVVWMVSTLPLISKSSCPFNNPSMTVPKSPITIRYYFTPWEFFILGLADSLPQESPQVSRTLLSVWADLLPSRYFQILLSLYQSFSDCTKSTCYNVHNRHFHVPQFFSISSQGRATYPSFRTPSILLCAPPGQQYPQFCMFFPFCWLLLYSLGWLVGWLVRFYGLSTFVGYLTSNPFLCK